MRWGPEVPYGAQADCHEAGGDPLSKILVCGSRNWTDRYAIRRVLLGEVEPFHTVVVHGAARGADAIAGEEAEEMEAVVRPYPAQWRRADGTRDRAAGYKRNQRMLDENPDIRVVWAFKDGFDFELKSGGTEDMARRAKAAGLPVYVVSHA